MFEVCVFDTSLILHLKCRSKTFCVYLEVCVLLSLLVSSEEWTEVIWKETRPLSSQTYFCPLVESTAETLKGLFFYYKELFYPKTTSTNMTSNSNLSNMRRLVEQLKLEASVERIKVKKRNGTLEESTVLASNDK